MSGGVENKSGGAGKNSGGLTGKVHRNAKDLERLIENLSVDGMMDGVEGGVVGSGLRGGSTLATTMGPGGNATKRDEERRKFTRAMYRAMKEYERLSAEIAELDAKIAAFEDDVFTDEDKQRIGKLPKDQQQQAKIDLMQLKLQQGLITQAEYDQWLKWQQERDAKAAQRAEVAETLEHADEKTIVRTVEEKGVVAAAKAAGDIGGQQAAKIDDKSEEHVDVGNEVVKNGIQGSGFSAMMSGKSVLGGGLGGTSVASSVAPDDAMTGKVSALKPVFTERAGQTSPVDPDAKSDLIVAQSNGNDPVLPGLG